MYVLLISGETIQALTLQRRLQRHIATLEDHSLKIAKNIRQYSLYHTCIPPSYTYLDQSAEAIIVRVFRRNAVTRERLTSAGKRFQLRIARCGKDNFVDWRRHLGICNAVSSAVARVGLSDTCDRVSMSAFNF